MNIPNILTTIRFLLVPIFIFVFYSPGIENNVLWATGVFVLAGITDVLDGYIARTYDMVTKCGTLLDPLADKLIQFTVLICFTNKGYLPIGVIIILGIKELLMIIGGIFLYYSIDKTVIPSDKFGKMATVIFYITILVIALQDNKIISYIFITLTLASMILAFINYAIGFRKIHINYNQKDVDN